MSDRNHCCFEDKENLFMHTPQKVQVSMDKENLGKNANCEPDRFVEFEISQDDFLFEKKRFMARSVIRIPDFELRLT